MIDFVPLAALAERLGCCTRTVRRRIHDGSIPADAVIGKGSGMRVQLERALSALQGDGHRRTESAPAFSTREGTSPASPTPSIPPAPSAPSRAEKTKTPVESKHPGLVEALGQAHAAGVESLLLVTLTAPAVSDSRFEAALDEFSAKLSAWGVQGRNRTGDGERHAHLIVAVDEPAEDWVSSRIGDDHVRGEARLPRSLLGALEDFTNDVGAMPEAQHTVRVTGWQLFAATGEDTLLRPNLWRIVGYLGAHEVRRVVRSGLFDQAVADAGEPAREAAPNPIRQRAPIRRVESFAAPLSAQFGADTTPRPAGAAPEPTAAASTPRPASPKATRSQRQPRVRNRAPNGNTMSTPEANAPPFTNDLDAFDSDAAYAPPSPAEAAAQTASDESKRRRSEPTQPDHGDDTPPKAA